MKKVVNKYLENMQYYTSINLIVRLKDTCCSVNTYSYEYRANDQRVIKSDNYITTAYIHGMSDFPQMEKIDEGSTEITKLFVYGPTGLIAVNDNEGWFFMLKDHLGSTRVVLDEANNKVSSYDYMPYGNIMRSSVNTTIPYQYTGQEYDTELNLHNFRARLYDSDLGMFYGVDPV